MESGGGWRRGSTGERQQGIQQDKGARFEIFLAGGAHRSMAKDGEEVTVALVSVAGAREDELDLNTWHGREDGEVVSGSRTSGWSSWAAWLRREGRAAAVRLVLG
uniref:Uncharacterized protein n=1 Tax=Arundo donax TaxID=35708 RepID=A0A0A9GJ20_ARUDO